MRRLAAALLLLAVSCAEKPRGEVDDLGRSVDVPAGAKRIVTLAPNVTEIVFAIGAGDRVVATDDFSNVPEAASRLPKVGGVQPNIERIVAAKPDLVLAVPSSNLPAMAASLGAAKIPLFAVSAERLDHVPRTMEKLATLLEVPDTGAASRLRDATTAARRQRSRKPRVLMLIWTEPLYVAGRDTFANDLFELCGAMNAVDVKGWPQYSLESLVTAPPDLILYASKSVQPVQIEALLQRAPALRAAAVSPIDEDRFTRPGPRLHEAAAELNAILDTWERTH